MNKFLDDANIVKKESKNSDVVLSIEDEHEEDNQTFVKQEEPSITISENFENEFKEFKNKIIELLIKISEKEYDVSNHEVEKIDSIKSKKDVIIETLNRFQNQIVLKEIDLKLYGNLFDNANNTNERNRYKLTMDNLKDDIRTLNKKIDIVKDMLK
jgi:predicted  nucleic acid-binding Zn-ribbon protein